MAGAKSTPDSDSHCHCSCDEGGAPYLIVSFNARNLQSFVSTTLPLPCLPSPTFSHSWPLDPSQSRINQRLTHQHIMVNVTKSNFLPQLQDFLHHLPTATYIAIDEEMTGIQLPPPPGETYRRLSKVELPGERYLNSLKGVPERYSILQVGVALFCKNPEYGAKKNAVGGGVADGNNNEGGSGTTGLGFRSSSAAVEEQDLDTDVNEHAYMHREGTLNQDELEDLTEREEDAADAREGGVADTKEIPEYTSRIYNFYLFPSGASREVTLNPSTVKFLLENHMDFDMVFRDGIPFTTVSNANQLKERFFEKRSEKEQEGRDGAGGGNENGNKTPIKTRVKLTRPEDIAFVARTLAGLREWIDAESGNGDGNPTPQQQLMGDHGVLMEHPENNGGNSGQNGYQDGEGTNLILPPCNAFLRRCLYETIEAEYPGLVLEKADSTGVGRNQIRVIRLSADEKKRREDRMLHEEWERLLLDNIGFTTIFQAISDACNGKSFSKAQTDGFLSGQLVDVSIPVEEGSAYEKGREVPLIIHNGLQDLMFLLTHCDNAKLPESFEDTKKLIQQYFPTIYDTKVLSTEYSDAIIKGGSTALGDLFDATCRTEPDEMKFTAPTIANQNGEGTGQAHEAAYDAYMTGCVFAALSSRILCSGRNGLTLDQLLQGPSDNLPRELLGLNKIYMHLSLYTIDLESSSGPPGLHDPLSSGLSIETTFHVSGISTNISTRDIYQCLSIGNRNECELLQHLQYEIIWVDDTSFFVGAKIDDDISADDSSAIALHVCQKLNSGLGGGVTVLAFGSYFKDKARESKSTGILGSLVSVVASPFHALGGVLGLGKRSNDGEGNGQANKRRRLG